MHIDASGRRRQIAESSRSGGVVRRREGSDAAWGASVRIGYPSPEGGKSPLATGFAPLPISANAPGKLASFERVPTEAPATKEESSNV
jgi:hypothetical protein